MHEPTQPPSVTTIMARLVREIPLACGQDETRLRSPIYRPLIVGPAVLRRPTEAGNPWRVTLQADGAVRPRVPATRRAVLAHVASLRAAGVQCRLAAALVAPEDVVREAQADSGRSRRGSRCRSEFYGWSLLYHPPGTPRIGLIEPHAEIDELPAFFESPFELLERSALLAARGIPSRPLALLTQPEDFVRSARGRVNRFFPAGSFRRPSSLDWLVR